MPPRRVSAATAHAREKRGGRKTPQRKKEGASVGSISSVPEVLITAEGGEKRKEGRNRKKKRIFGAVLETVDFYLA